MENHISYKIPTLSDNIYFNRLDENKFIVCNSMHKHYLRINKHSFDLLNLVDGKRNLHEICILFNRNNNTKINIKNVNDLLYNYLAQYGILKESNEENIKPYKKPNYLKLSFIIINERILSKIVILFNFLFYKKVFISTSLICISIITTLTFIHLDTYQKFNLHKSLIYFFLATFFSVTFHEIGHATAANHFGARHGGIGGGFYLFTPVYFADVTDIWRLNKKQRVIVNIAGIYFEFIFCSSLAIIGLLTDNIILMVISIIVCVRSLFNLNPFLRSDGYWIVSDLINQPNLFDHSSNKIIQIYKWVKGEKINKWNGIDTFLFIYGLINYFIILLFLYYILFQNPNSILKFHINLWNFIQDFFNKTSEINIIYIGNLIAPIFFYFLIFKLVKSIVLKNMKHFLNYFQKNSAK